jgi:mannose-1-phosphate guanylyltransferase
MKAFLLGGGFGTRLRPLTDSMPKCLVEVGSVPLLSYWLDLCEREGIGSVLLNVSRHARLVRDYLSSSHSSVAVTLVEEPEPRGSAGTVAAHRDFVDGERSFFVFYSDTLVVSSLHALRSCHARHQGPLTMGLFRSGRGESVGAVELEEPGDAGRIVAFHEKTAGRRSTIANAGVYLARQTLFDEIPAGRAVVDFGYDVLPQLHGRMYGCVLEGPVVDVGTPEGLAEARALQVPDPR